MECDHPSFVPDGPLLGKLWYFQYLYGGRLPSTILNFKILIFDHVAVIVVLTSCCLPNFIKIGSRVLPPDAYNCAECPMRCC